MTSESDHWKLPADWEFASIGNKFVFTRKPKGLRLEDYERVPFIPMDRIPSDRLFFSDFALKPSSDVTSGTYFEEGDLLVSKITPCFENGKQGIVRNIPDGFGIATTEVIPLKPIEGVSHLPFLAMYLLHPDIRTRLAGRMEGATGRQRLPKAVLEQWSMPFPPVPEQRAIADVLSKIQGAVEVQDKLVTMLKELKAATTAKLFREGLHSEPLKQTEIGEIPKSWEVVPLGQLLRTAQYGLSVRGEKTGRYPILRMNCQEEGEVVFRDLQYVDLDEITFNAFKLNDGDILFNRTNSIDLVGRTAIFRGTEAAVFASYLIRLCLDERMILPDFLNYYLNLERAQVALKTLATRGVSQSNISASKLRLFHVPLPPKQDQAEVIKTLHGLTGPLEAAIRKRNILRTLFSSMLHLLMTGQVRVDCDHSE